MNNSLLLRPPNCGQVALYPSSYNELKREKHKAETLIFRPLKDCPVEQGID
jgi:hypothetical protein